MKALAAFACLLIGMCVGPVRGESVEVTGHPQFQAWADRSLTPTPGFRVYARNRSCPFITPPSGMVVACAKRFTVWVELGYGGSQWRFFHELGHVVHRQVFGGRWLEPEEFAERFAQCGIYGETGSQVHAVPAGWCRQLSGAIKRSPDRWRPASKGQVK